MPHAAVNGVRLYYEVAGDASAPPLLLIAGLASDSASWAPVAGPLSKHFRLIMPDNRAVGRTAPLDAPTGVSAMADDALALLDHLGVARAHLLGHSMGGNVAALMAARAPERVAGLILAASPAADVGAGPRNRALLQTLTDLRMTGASEELWHRTFFLLLFKPDFFASDAVVDEAVRMALAYPERQLAPAFAHQVSSLLAERVTIPFDKITAPTRLLCGRHDLMFPPHEIAESAQTSGFDAPLVAVGAGHALHWDDPTWFCERTAEFLSEVRP